MLSRLPRNAPAWLDRLSEWLEPFEVCFTHVAQRGAFRRYLLGLLSDSRRKSMSAMTVTRRNNVTSSRSLSPILTLSQQDCPGDWRLTTS